MKKVLAYIILSMVICGSIFASDFYTNKEVKETSPQVKDFVMVFRDPEGGEIWVPEKDSGKVIITTSYEIVDTKKESLEKEGVFVE